MSRRCALFGALILSSTPLFAGDFYVDAVNGNNANSGASSGAAWRTISFALSVVPTPSVGSTNTIHIAAGTYDFTLGESLPLVLRPGLQLVGTSGATTIDAGGQALDVIQMDSAFGSPAFGYTADTLIKGLSLRRGRIGVSIRSNGQANDSIVMDTRVSEMSVAGISVNGSGAIHPHFELLTIETNQLGIDVAGAFPSGAGFDLIDSTVRTNLSHGIRSFSSDNVDWTIRRCRIESNAGDGIHASQINTSTSYIDNFDTLIQGNGGSGVWLQTQYGAPGPNFINLDSCTIAQNAVSGVAQIQPFPFFSFKLSESIVFGNGDDIAGVTSGSQATASYSDIGDNDFSSSPGVFHADPQFVNAAAGDYHLQPGSPCIDTGKPTSPQDADCSRSDVGVFPFLRSNPSVYCTAKLNSCGTLPAISAVGSPSASAASGFVVSAVRTKAGKSGLLMYGVSGRANLPFQGGTLCIATLVKRSTIVVDTIGTPGQCNGVLQLDMNAFAAGTLGGNPLAALRVPSTRVEGQFWGRDSPTGSLLSDAIEWFVCP